MLEVMMPDSAVICVDDSGSGESVLLVHGASQTRAAWSRLAPLLTDNYRVFNMDRRGRGGSTDGSSYSLGRESEDIVRVVEKLPEPVHLIAHSYGALCALEALRLTDVIASAILYEPPIASSGYSMPGAAPLRDALNQFGPEASLDAFMRDYVGLAPAAIKASRRDLAWPARVALAHTICREVEAVSGYRLEPGHFAGVDTPVLVLSGECSPAWMAAGTQAVADALPRGERRTLAGQGHVAMLTAPQLLAAVIGSHARVHHQNRL